MPRMTEFELAEYERKHPKQESVTIFQKATKDASLSDIRESDLQQEIEDWLKTQSHRIWWARCRMNCATTFTREGIPDFLICFAGLFVACEVKRPGKKPTMEQNGELAWIRKAGGIECVATSLSEVQALIELLTYRVENKKPNL